MKEIAAVLTAASGSPAERRTARQAFLRKRRELWRLIQAGRFPAVYTSAHGRRFVGAPRRTAIRCDFLLASKAVLGAKYRTDPIADAAQRDLLFYVLRDREIFPHRTGKKFYCCPKCTGKLFECVSANLFRYVDNAKWRAAIRG